MLVDIRNIQLEELNLILFCCIYDLVERTRCKGWDLYFLESTSIHFEGCSYHLNDSMFGSSSGQVKLAIGMTEFS